MNIIRCVSGANLNLFRNAAMILVLLTLGIGNAWGGSDSYYANVTASANPTGAGAVYVKANATTGATTGDEASATSPDKQNTDYNFALLAVTGYGYEFSQWALGTNPSGGTQSLKNAGSRTTAYVTARTKNSDGTLYYTVTANFKPRTIETAGVTETSLTSPQTWRAHGSAATVEFEDKYVLQQSDITISYPSDISTVAKTTSWKIGTADDEGAATQNGKMTVTLSYDFSNPTALVHNPSATMTVKEQISSLSRTSSPVGIGLDLTPNFSTDKSSHTFPATEINTTANATISASSYGDLPVSNSKCVWSYTLTGTNANQFSCSLTNGVATITYKPTAAGTHNASLTMTAQWTDAAGTVLTYSAPAVPINGTATAPDFSIGNLSYETTTDVGAKTKSLTLTNISYVTSATIAFSGENASCFSATTYNSTTKSFDITFTPPVAGGKNQAGTYTATATVTGSAAASDAVRTCTLTAVVSPAPLADFTVPSALTFNNGEDMADGTTDDQTLTLTNMQNIVGTPTITISGTDASMYAVQGGYDGENNAFTIRFTASGTKGGKLTANATVTVENYDGVSVSKTVELNAFMEEVVSSDVRVTKANGDTEECDWATAFSSYQAAGNTFTILRNIDLGTITATKDITKAITIDLNGKTVRAAVNKAEVGILNIKAAVTIKDSRGNGKILNEHALNGQLRTITVTSGSLTLESGTIAVNNLGQYASAAATVEGVSVAKYASCQARAIHQVAGSMVNINGGKVEALGSRNVYGIVQAGSVATNTAGTSVLNINGGEVYAEAAYQAYGVLAYGLVNMEGGMVTGKTNTNLVDASYPATTSDPNLRNGNARGIDLGVGTANATATSNYFATLNMTGGTVKAINERVNAVDKGRAYGIIFDSSNATQADKTKTPDGTNSQKVTAVGSITGGKIEVNTGTYYGFGVYATGSYNSYDGKYNTIQLKNCTIDVTAHTYATGVMAFAAVGSANGAEYAADIEMTNCTVTATTTVGAYAEAAYVSSTYGTIYENGSYAAYKGEYAAAAKLTINSGTYTSTTATSNSYCIKAASGISNEEIMAKTIYGPKTNVALQQEIGGHKEAYPTLIIHGGTFTANTTNTKNAARAVHSAGHTTINGGIFTANASGTSAYALLAQAGTMKVSGAELHAEANSTAYGVLVTGGITDYTMFEYAAEAELNNLDVTATTRTGTEARGVSVSVVTKTQTEATREALSATNKNKYYNFYQIAEKAVAAKAKINGGTYRATAATTTAYGVVVSTTSVSATGAAHASAEGTIKNATFVVKTNGTTSATGIYAGGPTTIEGCNITVQPQTTTGYGVYINDKKTTLSNTTINVTTANTADATKSAAAYGIYNNASISSIGWIFEGELEANEGNVVDVKTTSGTTAYGVYTHAVNKAITSEVYTTAGTYVAAARTTINGGKYTAHANNTTGYAVVVADPVLGTEMTGIPTCIINGGKFKGTAGATPFADVSLAGEPGYFVLNGGYYVKDENLDKKLGEEMNKVAVKSGTPEYTEGYRWRVTDNMTGEFVCKIKENSTSYASLEEALQVVNASPSTTYTIIMIANYTLSKGDYVLPANTTLLVPYQSSQTAINGSNPKFTYPKDNVEIYEAPTPLYKLTFANGVNMSVYGKIEASAVTYLSNQGLTTHGTGVVSGKYGWLYLNEGSHIDLESGSALYAWGYVTGKGEINAKNGSVVYEDFQMGDWRGGTVESNFLDNKTGLDKKGVFVITHYYYQNIECPITYRAGAQGFAHGGTYMYYEKYGFTLANDPVPTTEAVKMIGTSGAMFLMDPATAGEDTWVRKEYDAETDYVNWTMNSGAKLGSVSIHMDLPMLGEFDVNSSDYVLPITSNFNIVANYGEIDITNHVCFIPGSKLTIKKEGVVNIPSGQRVFFYDQDDWKSYGGYWFNPYYSPSWKVNPRVATIGDKSKIKMPDAEVLVEGLLNVTGAIYTTAGGANIHSTRENAGKVKFGAALPASTSAIATSVDNKGNTTTLFQITSAPDNKPSFEGKALNSAWLKNEDGTYSKPTSSNTSAGDTWVYMQSLTEDTYEWTKASEDGCFTIRSTGDTKTYVHPSDWVAVGAVNANHAYPSEDGTRMFVNTEAASTSASCKWWDVNKTPEVIDGTTYYVANNENFDNYGTYYYWDNTTSYWKPKKVTVTWNDKDGNKITNGTFGDSYNFNTSPQFFGTNPTWANTATEKHDWIGWRDAEGNIYDKNATLPRATNNVTYTAYFETSKYQYTITFKNKALPDGDGKVIWSGLMDATTTEPAVCPVEPTQEPTISTVYEFDYWEGYQGSNLPAVTAAATYTAVYKSSTRQYHVTFYNYDAVTVLYETDVDYNTSPAYGGVTPFRANTSAFSYEWTGWQQGATHYGTTDNLALVTGDVYYVATFSQTDLKYQVLFKRQDGSIIDAPFFNFEETPTAFPANPTLASTVSTDYTFREWSPATLVPVTEDGKAYTALFDESPRQYTAHFVNYNGVSLNVDQTIDYNTVPAYTGAKPFHPNDSRNSYEFAGWAWEAGDGWEAGSIAAGEAFPAIKGDITFTAQFTPVLLQFNVIYQREDGTIIEQQKKKWGETTDFPTTGLKYEDETYTYTFDHWSPITVESPVTADATYTAYFNQSIKTYTISSIATTPAGYGTVSLASLAGIPTGSTVTVNDNQITVNGTTITATPAAATAQYTYAFSKWNNVPATVTSDVSIEAVFTRTVNQYTVLWKSEDGTSTLETDDNQNYGAATAFNGTTPTKDANAQYTYTFDGWATEANGAKVYEIGATPTVSGAATYYAHFAATLRKYTVSVAATPADYGTVSVASVAEVPYGTAVAVDGNQITVSGTTITATPAAATAQYTYAFSKWNNVPATVTSDVSIEAVFTRTVNQYDVTFNMKGHGSAISKQTKDYGSKVDKPADPSEAGYTFGGWYKEEACTNAWNFTTDEVTATTILYAKWTVNTHKLAWNFDGGTPSGAYTEANNALAYGSTIAYPTLSKAGYTFAGWSTSATSMPDADLTITASWTVNTHKLAWNFDGGTPSGNYTEANNALAYGSTIAYPTLSKTGYTFAGWSTNVTSMPDADLTITASWTVNTHKLAWNFDGGTPSGAYTEANNALAYGSTIAYPTLSKAGYTFAGWSTSATSMPDADLTITASWTVNTHKLAWNFDGGTPSGSYTEANNALAYGSTITYPTLSKAGYTFAGWSTSATSMPDADLTITASWTVNTHKLAWNFDGGTPSGAYTEANDALAYGSTITYPTLSKTGYTFAGWSSDATSMPDADLTITASWTPINYTISYNNLEDATNSNPASYTIESADITLENPGERTGYDFGGWYTNEGLTDPAGTPAIAHGSTGDKTFWAKWTLKGYTITWLNDDDTEIGQTTVAHGVVPTHAAATKANTEEYTYAFTGWTPTPVEATGPATYTATYKAVPLRIEVSTKDNEIDVTTTVVTTIIHKDGELNVTAGHTLTTTDLILEASESKSGEITGNVEIGMNAYFDLAHTGGFKARTWYAIAVPWQVNVPKGAKGGVYIKNGETLKEQLLGTTFDLIYYDGASRAEGKTKAWKYLEYDPVNPLIGQHIMSPGVAYMIYLTEDAEVIRFQKRDDAPVHTESVAVSAHESFNTIYENWNGIANPATYHAYLNVLATENIGQVYNAETKGYKKFVMSANRLVAGQPIFVQTPAPAGSRFEVDRTSYPSYAPRRAKEQVSSLTRFELYLAPSMDIATDEVIVRMSEEKQENDYVIGQDLVKMGVSAIVPQIWIDRYDSKMFVNTVAPEEDNTADYPLGIFVPKNGEYDLFIDDQPNDETMLYLTYDGEAIWNLSYGPYVASLEKGTNTHYGLRIVKKAPQTATGIEETTIQNGETIRKVLVNDKVYIIRNGEIYSVTGQKAQ